jgi:hypothetical protein
LNPESEEKNKEKARQENPGCLKRVEGVVRHREPGNLVKEEDKSAQEEGEQRKTEKMKEQ